MMRRALLALLLGLGLLIPGRLAVGTVLPPAGRVAYASRGAIWLLDLQSGQRQKLLDSEVAFRPDLSASGRYLTAWNRGRSFVIDGAHQRLLAGAVTPPVWSPTQDLVAYWTVDGHLVVETADGIERGRIKGRVLKHLNPPVWSPNGESLAYVETIGDPPHAEAKLFRFTLGASLPEELFTYRGSDPPCLFPAAWPMADRLLAWYQGQCSESLAVDGLPLGAISIKERRLDPVIEASLRMPVAISGLGDVAVTAGAGRYTWVNKRIAVLAAGKGLGTVVSPPGQAAIQPAWSPDAKSLAWSAMPEAPENGRGRGALGERRLWRWDRGADGPRQLTFDPAYRDESPIWTSDGEHLLFARLDQEERVSLWLLPLRTGRPQKLADLDRPVWGDPSHGWIAWENLFDYAGTGAP